MQQVEAIILRDTANNVITRGVVPVCIENNHAHIYHVAVLMSDYMIAKWYNATHGLYKGVISA